MFMTFYTSYRGPAWESGHGHGPAAPAIAPAEHARDTRLAAVHGTVHPADTLAHGHAAKDDHELSHGPAAHADDDHGGGHGPWHGPHESPTPMTFPLMALAVGAMVAGFVGIPGALGGSNEIERFLEPSFTPSHVERSAGELRPNDVVAGSELERGKTATGEVKALEHEGGAVEESGQHVSRAEELGLMALSLGIAISGILLARKFYVTSPEISTDLAERFAGAHTVLSNKYYVDELYDATVISGTFAAGNGLWAVDRNVVDGAVNGSSWITVIAAWFSGLTDRAVVDGLVNLVARIVQESSLAWRRIQTGLVQNYALLMLFGIFAFVSVYLFVR
jgi:NADH-quinone oxidoreductase subunit L